MDGDGVTRTVAHFATGLQVTTVVRTPDGRTLWRRRPGADAEPCAIRESPRFATAAATASGAGIAFVPARHRSTNGDVPDSWEWQAPSAVSVALLVSSNAGGNVLLKVMAALGEQLRVLHTIATDEVDDLESGPPSWLQRLRTWMEAGSGTRAAQQWHQALSGALGTRAWSRLEEWVSAVPGAGSSTWTHGFLTLGSVVVSLDSASPSTVLSGPDAAAGRREVDLGCVLGELAEFRNDARRRGAPVQLIDALHAEFLRGYGDTWSATLAARVGALRIAAHAHDFAAYVGWADELLDYTRHLRRLLNTDAEEILAPLTRAIGS